MLVTRSLCKMMEKLGVSDSNSYLWNTPIWGHQFGELPFIQPPPPFLFFAFGFLFFLGPCNQ